MGILANYKRVKQSTMKTFTELQDSNKTWHTKDPFFTQCFELTILVWIPCAILFVFIPLDIYYIKSSKYANIPWGFVNIARLTFPMLLICLCIADLSMAGSLRDEFNLHNVYIVTPVVKLITFVSCSVVRLFIILLYSLILSDFSHNLSISA